MDASTSLLSSRVPARVARMFLVALLAAFLLGGTGGYVARGWNLAAQTGTTPETTTHRVGPFVTEPVPYESPVSSPAPEPTLDPRGVPIPI